jgi:hypothetical protein
MAAGHNPQHPDQPAHAAAAGAVGDLATNVTQLATEQLPKVGFGVQYIGPLQRRT